MSGQGMLPTEEGFFKNGKVNKEALVDFIKTIKKEHKPERRGCCHYGCLKGGGQPTEDPDLVQDQRNEEHDWGQENPTYLQDERQTKRGFEHPCLGGRGDEGIGGQQGEPHHPPGVHLSLGGTALPYGCLRKFACSPFQMSQLITRAAFIC